MSIYTVYLLCSDLNNEEKRQSAPLTETLYYTSTRRASSRYAGETATGKSPVTVTENKREMLMLNLCAVPAHVNSARAACADGAQLPARTRPALRTGLMALAWRPLHVSRRVTPDLKTRRNMRHARAPTSPRSTGFCVIGPYGICNSSSSSSSSEGRKQKAEH